MTVDAEQSALSGVSRVEVVGAVEMALRGREVSHLSTPNHRTTVPLRVELSEADRSSADRLGWVHLQSVNGGMVPLAERLNTGEPVGRRQLQELSRPQAPSSV